MFDCLAWLYEGAPVPTQLDMGKAEGEVALVDDLKNAPSFGKAPE
jgi:hypothetical protein